MGFVRPHKEGQVQTDGALPYWPTDGQNERKALNIRTKKALGVMKETRVKQPKTSGRSDQKRPQEVIT